MTLVPTVDPLACAGHGDCVGTDQDSVILAAAEACPSAAIVVHDADGALVFP